jgi:urease accessory protein
MRTIAITLESLMRPRRAIRSGDSSEPAPPPAGEVDALPLLVWLSPAFPIGSFAYSHGIEWSVEAGDVVCATSLHDWLADLLEHGGPWSDAVLLGHAHRACATGDDGHLTGVAELALALSPSRERRLETEQQGSAFLTAVAAGWPCDGLERARAVLGDAVALPVAVAIAASGHGLAAEPTIAAYAMALASNLISAAVRLVPLGQTDGVRVTALLAPLVRSMAARAAAAPLEDVGGCALRSDIAAMRHETQTTRLFRS